MNEGDFIKLNELAKTQQRVRCSVKLRSGHQFAEVYGTVHVLAEHVWKVEEPGGAVVNFAVATVESPTGHQMPVIHVII